MRRLSITAALAATLLASCSNASSEAMTPEETVAFILFGMKGGVPVFEHETKISVEKEKDAPLVLNLTLEGNKVASVHVEKQANCRYNAIFDLLNIRGTGQSMRFGGVYDLSSLKSATFTDAGPQNSVKFEGVSLTCPLGCSDADRRFQENSTGQYLWVASPDKAKAQADLTAAVESFHANVCPSK